MFWLQDVLLFQYFLCLVFLCFFGLSLKMLQILFRWQYFEITELWFKLLTANNNQLNEVSEVNSHKQKNSL